MTSRPETHYLRLFPLQAVVLFPQMELPLVVFEPRYVQLTQECTDADEPFGVVLLKEGLEVGENDADPFKIGTTEIKRNCPQRSVDCNLLRRMMPARQSIW